MEQEDAEGNEAARSAGRAHPHRADAQSGGVVHNRVSSREVKRVSGRTGAGPVDRGFVMTTVSDLSEMDHKSRTSRAKMVRVSPRYNPCTKIFTLPAGLKERC
jgi:hypothetical protein